MLDETSAEAIALAELEVGPFVAVGPRIADVDHAGAAELFHARLGDEYPSTRWA